MTHLQATLNYTGEWMSAKGFTGEENYHNEPGKNNSIYQQNQNQVGKMRKLAKMIPTCQEKQKKSNMNWNMAK